MDVKDVLEDEITSKCKNFKKNKLKCKDYNKRYVVDGEGFEPSTSAMPTPRSFQADLPAQPYSSYFLLWLLSVLLLDYLGRSFIWWELILLVASVLLEVGFVG